MMAAEGITTDLSEAWPSVADMLQDIEKQGGASCAPPEDLLSRYGGTTRVWMFNILALIFRI